MDTTIGKRISHLRKEKQMSQEELATMLGVSGQAVSKWENDQTCPDISLLPKLAEMLGVSVDELLSGKKSDSPAVKLLPEDKRKPLRDMMLRIVVDSAEGDKVRVNLPMAILEIAREAGIEMPQISGNEALRGIDWERILEMVSYGVTGNLVEVESADGDVVRIFVE